MSDHVHTLTEKVAYLLYTQGGSSENDVKRWSEAEDLVKYYLNLRDWRDPENDIAWHLDTCSMPPEYQGNRREMAWHYLSWDVFDLPQVVATAA